MRNISNHRFIIPLLLFVAITGCRRDELDQYLGIWTFRVIHSKNTSGAPGKTVYTVVYKEGFIARAKGSADLTLKYGDATISFNVAGNGTISNLPGDYHYGNFEGTDIVSLTFGHQGNYVDLTSIYGRKGFFMNNPPAVSTDLAKPLTSGAVLSGTVNANTSETEVVFEYGRTTAYGNSINGAQNFLKGFDDVAIFADVTGLASNTLYHFRIMASNSSGTSHGKNVTFTTSALTEPVTDIDANVYRTVRIGDQVWMGENLKVTKLNNGSPLSAATGSTWSGPSYCYYNNDSSFRSEYGALYNFSAVQAGNLCPLGWHVPSDHEWTILEEYLSGTGNFGGSLKETGTSHWMLPNTGATNVSGFNALPAGERSLNGAYTNLGTRCYFWSSTITAAGFSWVRFLYNDANGVTRMHLNANLGFSVRCLRN